MKLVDDIKTLADERETRAAFLVAAAAGAFILTAGLAADSKSAPASLFGILGVAFTAGAIGSIRDSRQSRGAIDPDTNELKLSGNRPQ